MSEFILNLQYSQRGSRITPRSRGGVIILPALPRRGDSSRGFAGRSDPLCDSVNRGLTLVRLNSAFNHSLCLAADTIKLVSSQVV